MTKDITEMKNPISCFRTLCGFERVDDTLQIVLNKSHMNGGGIMHGGLTATLLDHVSSLPITLKKGQLMATIDLNVQYLSLGRIGQKLTATANLKKQGRDIAFIDACVKNENGVIIATSSAIYKIFTLNKKK